MYGSIFSSGDYPYYSATSNESREDDSSASWTLWICSNVHPSVEEYTMYGQVHRNEILVSIIYDRYGSTILDAPFDACELLLDDIFYIQNRRTSCGKRFQWLRLIGLQHRRRGTIPSWMYIWNACKLPLENSHILFEQNGLYR